MPLDLNDVWALSLTSLKPATWRLLIPHIPRSAFFSGCAILTAAQLVLALLSISSFRFFLHGIKNSFNICDVKSCFDNAFFSGALEGLVLPSARAPVPRHSHSAAALTDRCSVMRCHAVFLVHFQIS